MVFSIFYWNPQTQIWVDFIKTHESEALQKKIAENMSKTVNPMEYLGSYISYFADQVGWPTGCSSQWKVIGPPGYTLPSYLGARYEDVGQEDNSPPR